jgi:hypothetical protein
MKKLYALILLLFIGTSNTMAQGGIVVYDGAFDGGYKAVPANWNIDQIDLIWNDKISSIHVPKGYKIAVFTDLNYQGEKLIIDSRWQATGDFAKWDNKISSIKILEKPEEYSMVYTCYIWHSDKWERFDDLVLASNGLLYSGTRPIQNQTQKGGTTVSWSMAGGNSYDAEVSIDGKKIIGWINHSSLGKINLKGDLFELRKNADAPFTSRTEKEAESTTAVAATPPVQPTNTFVVYGNVKLYKSNNFTGESKIITSNWNPKNYPESYNWGGKVNAIKVSEGWSIRLYRFKDFSGSYIDISDDWSSAQNAEWKNNIGSIKIVRKGRIDQHGTQISSGVKLYKSNNFNGESKYITSNWSPNAYPESYNWGSRVNSIKVPEGWGVRLYRFKNFSGSYLEITDDWKSSNNPEWKDNIGSIKIVAKPQNWK